MTNARIKVDVAKLIQRIEEKKAEAITAFEDKAAQAERDQQAWREAVADALFAAEGVDASELATTERYHNELRGYVTHVLVPVPNHQALPREVTLDTSQYDKDIAMLRLSSEATITIGVDTDLGRRYL